MSFSNIPRPQKSPEIAQETAPKPLSLFDKNTLTELLSIFNPAFISFYANHDFNGAFRNEFWSPLSEFCDTWNDVTHEFIDREMESKKKQLYNASLKIATVISRNTVSRQGIRSVYPMDKLYTEQARIRFQAEAKEINDECDAFVAESEAFVRYARERLAAG